MFEAMFTVVIVLWGISEVLIGRRLRTKVEDKHDGGTMKLVLIAAYASTAVAIFFGLRDGMLVRTTPAAIAGLAMIVFGMILRGYAIYTLRQFFTINVTVREGHRLIRSGPYRFIRHPSYTGSLLSFYGLALALEHAWAALVLVVPITVAFVMRMRVEEAVLRAAFPEEYPEYESATFRLVPYVY